MGVGLQVLTKTVCSLIFYLQHQWRCCQTIACLGPCTPGTISLEESWKLWFIHQYFFPHAKVYLISSLLCCVCLGFIFFFSFWSHKRLLGRSVHLPGYLFVVRLEPAGSEETSIVQPEHHFPDEAQMAGVLENIIDKQ